MFRYVPFMNMFKYAAYISVFGSLAFILLAANFMATIQIDFKVGKKKIIFVGILLLVGLVFLIFYSTGKITSEDFKMLASQKNISEWLKSMTFYQRVLGQSVFQFIVASLFLLIIFFHKKLKYPFQLIFVLFVVEILFASQLNIVFTVADNNYKPFKMKNDLSLFPDGFPIPVNDKVIFNDNMHESFPPFWRNTYVFTKQVSFNAFSSFELNSFNKLDDDYPNLKNAVLNNHLFYFSDKTFPLNQFSDSLIDNLFVVQNEEFDFLLDGTGAIAQPSAGEVYVPVAYQQSFGLETGDELTIRTDAGNQALTVRGFVRDSQMASSLSSATRFLVSNDDFAALASAGLGSGAARLAAGVLVGACGVVHDCLLRHRLGRWRPKRIGRSDDVAPFCLGESARAATREGRLPASCPLGVPILGMRPSRR